MSTLRGISFALMAVSLGQQLKPQSAPASKKGDTVALTEWKARIPIIETILTDDKFSCPVERHDGILDAFGVRDDELSVALVDFCPGGAYTDWIVAVRLKRGKPVPAEFRDAKGKQIENFFGRGASVMNSVDVKLVPEKRAIYDMHAESDPEGRPAAKCDVKAYVWNPGSRTFDQDSQLSKTATEDYCRDLRNPQQR